MSLLLLFLCGTPVAGAARQSPAPVQPVPPELEALAARVAQEIEAAHVRSVVVARFTFKKEEHYALGKLLSQQFQAALRKADPELDVVEWSRFDPVVKDHHLIALDKDIPDALAWMVLLSGVETVVEGQLEEKGDTLKLAVSVLRTDDVHKVAREKAKLQSTPAMKNILDQPVRDAVTGVYLPGVAGVKFPECLQCPRPTYTNEARIAGTEGSLNLLMTISAEGKPEDIVLIRGLGHGLDELAISTAPKWKVRPALGPDGKPVAVRATVEIKFRVFR